MNEVPIRPITTGPKHHWFGYYDKLQFDPTCRFILGMQVDFEHRSPTAEDEIRIGLIDTRDGDSWREIGSTQSWGWQQGCMLQWIPGSSSEVIWNQREGDRFVARIHDTADGSERTLPRAVYTISPDGRSAIGADFRRINDMRPGYGYAGLPDPNSDVLAPDDVGIYTVDLTTGDSQPIISIAQVAAIPLGHASPERPRTQRGGVERGDISEAKHYFNHLLYNTDGTRFIFLHRWRFGEGGFHTRMLTAAADGSDLHVVDDYGKMSHFIWRDSETILAWSWQPSHESAFYLYEDQTDHVEVIGEGIMTLNGHCTYLPDTDWILNDCYPQGESRDQQLYLYHVPTSNRIELGSFASPEPYTGEWRCDLHPRFSPDGTRVTIDSAHGGNGRQICELDIENRISSIG